MTNNNEKIDSHLKRKRKGRWILMCLLWVALVIITIYLPRLDPYSTQTAIDLVWRTSVMLFGSMGIVLAFNREDIFENQLATSMKQLRETAEISFQQRHAIGVGMLWDDKGGIAGCKVLGYLGTQDKNMSIQCTEALLDIMSDRGKRHLVTPVSGALSSFLRKWGNDGSYPDIRKLPKYFWETAGKEVYFPEVDLKGVDLSKARPRRRRPQKGRPRAEPTFSRYQTHEDASLMRSQISGRADIPREASLKGADLTDADLTDADLTGADLTGADLTDANLTDCQPHRRQPHRTPTSTDANLTDSQDERCRFQRSGSRLTLA